MKKWLCVIASILLIGLLGSGMITLHGHGERSYQACVRHGHYDVIDQDYQDALNYFQGAQKVSSSNNKAGQDLAQTQSYVSGNRYFDQDRLQLAAKNYHRSIKIDAIAALNHRSLKRYRYVAKIRRSSMRFAKWYDQALVLNHQGKFKSSIRRLVLIVKDPNVNLDYFRRFRPRVKALLSSDRKNDRSHLVTTTIGNRNHQAFKLKMSKIIGDHPDKVTIMRARREIQRAGINVHEMSNGNVANLIRQAHQHHFSIEKYAKDNY